MRWFPSGAWRFALMLLLLLILAALASLSTVQYLESLLSETTHRSPDELQNSVRGIVLTVLALTMGFLFLAGALGLWAIRSTSQIESRRRIGRFVDAMDYLSDGLLSLDAKGRITGMNPAARKLAGKDIGHGTTLSDLFPCVGPEDARLLLHAGRPSEVERASRGPAGPLTLRFRSQPSEDEILVLVSDVTDQKHSEMRQRQVALLQLIGRIARGVAHDFNNILCAISGHAALLERSGKTGKGDDAVSLDAIIHESQRGATLAAHLLELSRTGTQGTPCTRLAEHVKKTASLLRVGLSSTWQVVTDLEELSEAVPLTTVQAEQVVLNLGLLAADECARPGTLKIQLHKNPKPSPLDPGEEYAAVITISTSDREDLPAPGYLSAHPLSVGGEAGVIQSVVRTMLEEVGGRLDIFAAPDNRHSYRIYLPRMESEETPDDAAKRMAEEIRHYLAGWRILLAGPNRNELTALEQQLKGTGLQVERADDIVNTLHFVESDRNLNAMILDKRLLGAEAGPLLRAILKLQPGAGLVILSEATDKEGHPMESDVVFETPAPTMDNLLADLVKAKQMAVKRSRTG